MSSPARLPLTGLPVAGTGRRSATLAAWTTAWLGGRAAADDVVDAVTGEDEFHQVEGLPDVDTLADLLIDLRRRQATGLRLALPVPGDPRQLPGPGPLTDAALAAGEAVIVQTAPTDQRTEQQAYGLVPVVTRHGNDTDGYATIVRWQALPCPPAVPEPPGTLRQAERDLRDALRDASTALARLDVARLSPQAAVALEAMREQSRDGRAPVRLPRAHPTAAQALLAQADRLAQVLDIAGEDDGNAVDLGTVRQRRDVLRGFAAAVRRARVAAVNSPLDPPA